MHGCPISSMLDRKADTMPQTGPGEILPGVGLSETLPGAGFSETLPETAPREAKTDATPGEMGSANSFSEMKPATSFSECNKRLVVAHDIIDVLSGKWRMEVILSLLKHEKRRFKTLQKDISGISAKVLSSVLQDLELNHIVRRSVIDAAQLTVEYELTDYGKSMRDVIIGFVRLGMAHRKEVIGK